MAYICFFTLHLTQSLFWILLLVPDRGTLPGSLFRNELAPHFYQGSGLWNPPQKQDKLVQCEMMQCKNTTAQCLATHTQSHASYSHVLDSHSNTTHFINSSFSIWVRNGQTVTENDSNEWKRRVFHSYGRQTGPKVLKRYTWNVTTHCLSILNMTVLYV